MSSAEVARRMEMVGLGFLSPLVRLAGGEAPRAQLRELWRTLGVPLVASVAFLMLWSMLASRIETSLGQIPGPAAVWEQAGALWQDHKAERQREAQFHERQAARNAGRMAADPEYVPTRMQYTGRPTYIDQIFTSLKTVFAGFLLATLLAVPIGILCGTSRVFDAAFNPFVQVFKAVSPLAWLPTAPGSRGRATARRGCRHVVRAHAALWPGVRKRHRGCAGQLLHGRPGRCRPGWSQRCACRPGLTGNGQGADPAGAPAGAG